MHFGFDSLLVDSKVYITGGNTDLKTFTDE